jgi:hypothetical protein
MARSALEHTHIPKRASIRYASSLPTELSKHYQFEVTTLVPMREGCCSPALNSPDVITISC